MNGLPATASQTILMRHQRKRGASMRRITLDKNTHIFLVSGADVSLGANACVSVGNDGTEWRQLTAVLTAT